jgi:fructosamine-3-kinase
MSANFELEITNFPWDSLCEKISQATNESFIIADYRSVGGGCINRAYTIENAQGQRYFLKLNQLSRVEMFEVEASGLMEIGVAARITTPTPICWGVITNYSYLVLSHLNLADRGTPENWHELGRNLAQMHQTRSSNPVRFGWQLNNTIGSTPQINTWENNWAKFFANHRISYQLQLAQTNGGKFPQATALLAKIPQILGNHQPQPALVHGDLWSGNIGFTDADIPVIFDPAIYWGDREVDLAMTELFGGFPATFYQGYERVYPIDPGYPQRRSLYNLYHILNHYNLFGGSYQHQANKLIEEVVRS